jgi:protocatechuate 3,4-dioxygenase beta subunit
MIASTEAAREAKGGAGRHCTPDQILGPFFPTGQTPVRQDDLTRIEGGRRRATGEIIEVTGRILNRQGEPVGGARIVIWQANSFGRYAHSNDRNPAPLDPNFAGCVDILSTDAGTYRIRTVKPGTYPAGPDWIRPPHIHFEVHGRFERLVTQMYFPDEPLNASDRLLNSARHPELLIAMPEAPREGVQHRVLNFDIVLNRG